MDRSARAPSLTGLDPQRHRIVPHVLGPGHVARGAVCEHQAFVHGRDITELVDQLLDETGRRQVCSLAEGLGGRRNGLSHQKDSSGSFTRPDATIGPSGRKTQPHKTFVAKRQEPTMNVVLRPARRPTPRRRCGRGVGDVGRTGP